MTGHRSFNDLRTRMSPERRGRNSETTQAILREMALHELRQAREKTQQDVARVLHVNQPAVAKLEQRTDIYVSNLRRYVEALIYQMVNENMASEQSARMVAMKAASDNAETIIDELQLIYNKSRQAAITKELAEIVGGAAAV